MPEKVGRPCRARAKSPAALLSVVKQLSRDDLNAVLHQINEHLFFGEPEQAAIVLAEIGLTPSDAIRSRFGEEELNRAVQRA